MRRGVKLSSSRLRGLSTIRLPLRNSSRCGSAEVNQKKRKEGRGNKMREVRGWRKKPVDTGSFTAKARLKGETLSGTLSGRCGDVYERQVS